MGWNNKRGINKDSYQFVVFEGRDPEGKKIEKRKTVNLSHIANEKKRDIEAQRLFAIWQNETKNGPYVKKKITLNEFIDKWLELHAQGNLQPKTLLEYNKLLKRIRYSLGHLKLVDINQEHLLEFYKNLREAGVREDKKFIPKENFTDIITGYSFTYKDIKSKAIVADSVIASLKKGKSVQNSTVLKISVALNLKINILFDEVKQDSGLSEKTILHYHRLLATLFKYAFNWNYVTQNIVDKTDSPRVVSKDARYFDLKNTLAIFLLLKNEPIKYRLMVLLSIFTGMRLGEIDALTWSDVDLDTGQINVEKSLQHMPGKETAFKTTKTDKSRIVGVPQSVIAVLKEYKLWQDTEKEKLGDLWIENNCLFTTLNGKHIFPTTVSKWFLNFLREHNKRIEANIEIPKEMKSFYKLTEINFHGLRHTTASLLNSLGVELPRISKILGHSKISTTADIYMHLFIKFDTGAMDVLEKALGDNV